MQLKSASFQLRDIVESHVHRAPSSPALLFLKDGETEEARLSFGELHRMAQARAAWLQHSARSGDRAILAFPVGIDFSVSLLACLYAGIIPVPVAVPGRGRARDAGSRRLLAIAADCSPKLLLTTAAVHGHLPSAAGSWQCVGEAAGFAPEEFVPEAIPGIAILQYTSGSTGNPKGVIVPQRALHAQLEFHRRHALDTATSVLVGWLPHHHDFGLIGFHLTALYTGSLHVFMSPAAFLRRPHRWLAAISRYQAGYSGGPNFAYELCLNAKSASEPLDLGAWQIASVAGEPVNPDTLRRFAAAFEPHGFRPGAFLPAYGLAESVLCATARRGLKIQSFQRAALQNHKVVPATSGPSIDLVSCGQALEEHQVCIVDPETRQPLPPDSVGEIWLRGLSVGDGYWQEDGSARDLFQATLAGRQEPYLRTGDYGFLHGGELYVSGRLKDLILVRGANHAPEDLELSMQSAHAGLKSGCGAVFQTDGAESRLTAVQEVSRGIDAASHDGIFAAIRAAFANEHGLRPDTIVLLRPNTIPRTSSGKVRRHECRQLFQSGQLPSVGRWDAEAPRVTASAAHDDPIMAALLQQLRGLLGNVSPGPHDDLFSFGLDSLMVQRLLSAMRGTFGIEISPQAFYSAPTMDALSQYIRRQGNAGPVMPMEQIGSSILAELQAIRRLLERQAIPSAQPEPSQPFTSGEYDLTRAQKEIRLLGEVQPALAPALTRLLVLQLPRPLDSDTAYRAFREVANRHEALRLAIVNSAQRILPYADPDVRTASVASMQDVPAWLREERLRPFQLSRAPLWRVTLLSTEQDAAFLLVFAAHSLIADARSLNIIAGDFVRCWRTPHNSVATPSQFSAWISRERAASSHPSFVAHRDFWRQRSAPLLPSLDFPGDRPLPLPPSFQAGFHSVTCEPALRAALATRAANNSSTLFQLLLAAYFDLLRRFTGHDRLMIGMETAPARPEEVAVGCCGTLVPLIIDFSNLGSGANLEKAVRDEVVSALEHQDYTLSMLAEDLRLPYDANRPARLDATISFCSPPASDACEPRFDLAGSSVTQTLFPLSLDIRDSAGALQFEFTFQKAILGQSIERLAAWYIRLLRAAAKGTPLTGPIILDPEEQPCIAAQDAGAAPAQATLFAHAAPPGEGIASACSRRQLTFGELDREAGVLAAALAAIPKTEGPVGILCAPGCDYVIALAAVIRAGLTALPLDPGTPLQARRAGASLLLFSAELRELAEAIAAGNPTLCIQSPPDAAPLPTPRPGGALLLSSGPVTEAALASFLCAAVSRMRLTNADTIAYTGGPVWLMLLPLVSGVAMRFLHESAAPANTLLEAAEAHRITILPLDSQCARAILEHVRNGGARRLSGVRWLLSTGEPLAADLCRQWFTYYPRTSILSTFDTLACQPVEWAPKAGIARVPIGRPVPGVSLSVRDRYQHPAPAGSPGEVYAAGRPLGILGRFRRDGTLDYLGRLDDPYIRAGSRKDAAAIESVLRRSPAVRDALVTRQPGPHGNLALTAYVICRDTPATSTGMLRALVRNHLPQSDVPSSVVFVDSFPRTSAGAIDWGALPPAGIAAHPPADPSTPVEREIERIWRERLPVHSIGIHDDLFELGGNSLDAARIAAALRATFNLPIPVSAVFRTPTIAGVAAYVEQQLASHPGTRWQPSPPSGH